ncbi:MAG: hypothetical protein L0215_26695 [Gemmataceae bacterium]|nr:hypothetical protein [Gemmataceae bacterium]
MLRLATCIGFSMLAVSVPLFAQDNRWSVIKGRIVWGGAEIPKRMEIAAVDGNPDKKFCLKDGPVLDEKWVIHEKNKGIRWTIVWLANADPKDKTPLPIHPSLQKIEPKEVVMDQPVCTFIPHAIALREGQVLVAKNSAAAGGETWATSPSRRPHRS